MSKSEILEDILGGPPEANPSDVANYNDGSGVTVGAVNAPSQLDLDNMIARLNVMSERQSVAEGILRRHEQLLFELQSRLSVVEGHLGISKGLKV